MEVAFATKKLEKCYREHAQGVKMWGFVVARKYVQRIDILQEASDLAEIEALPGLECHPPLSQYRLAKEINVSQRRIGEIVAGKRAITADTDLRLCRFFGLSDGWWLRLQADYDTELAKGALAKTLAKIKPWTGSKRAA